MRLVGVYRFMFFFLRNHIICQFGKTSVSYYAEQLHYFFNNAIYLAKAHLYHFHNNGNKEKKTH